MVLVDPIVLWPVLVVDSGLLVDPLVLWPVLVVDSMVLVVADALDTVTS